MLRRRTITVGLTLLRTLAKPIFVSDMILSGYSVAQSVYELLWCSHNRRHPSPFPPSLRLSTHCLKVSPDLFQGVFASNLVSQEGLLHTPLSTFVILSFLHIPRTIIMYGTADALDTITANPCVIELRYVSWSTLGRCWRSRNHPILLDIVSNILVVH
jgi:hypothetical protein